MSPRLPPPQRPPTEQETAIITSVREWAAVSTSQTTDAQTWVSRLEGLRRLVIDTDAEWEENLVDAKNAGIAWSDLVDGLGLHYQSLQDRLRYRPAHKLAADTGRPSAEQADPQETAIMRAIHTYARTQVTGAQAWVSRLEGLRGLVIDIDAIAEDTLLEAVAHIGYRQLEDRLGISGEALRRRVARKSARKLAAQPRTPRSDKVTFNAARAATYAATVGAAHATRRAARKATAQRVAEEAAALAATPLAEPITVLPTSYPATLEEPKRAPISFGHGQTDRLAQLADRSTSGRSGLIRRAVQELVDAHARARVSPMPKIPADKGQRGTPSSTSTWLPQPGMLDALDAFARQWETTRAQVLRVAVELLLLSEGIPPAQTPPT